MERGMNSRTKKLRRESEACSAHLSMERSKLVTEAYKKHEGNVESPVLRALAFKHIMENKTLYLGDGELIVGEKGMNPHGAPTYPELCCHTIEDMEVMSSREKIFFKVSEEDLKTQKEVIIPFWEKKSIRNKIISGVPQKWRDAYYNGIFTEFMEQRSPGHTVADGKMYELGMVGFIAKIEERMTRLDFHKDLEAYDKKAELEAMKIVCEAMITFGERYAAFAREKAEVETDPKRKEELLQIAQNCDVVPKNKPQTYWQAIQMYWFVHIGITVELNNWDAYSPGRLDQHLNPFYENDIANGDLTKEKARELLECMWVKFNNQPAPPKVGITLKESGTYTDFANINTGGVTKDGHDGVNEVSYLILDTMEEMQLLQPSSNVQISKKSPQKFLHRACEVSRRGWGQPAFYNTDAIIQELLQAGKDIADARQGGSSGCVETGAFGKEAFILTGYFNLPKIFEITLTNGFDDLSGKQLGLELGSAKDFKTYEELFDAFTKQVKHFIDIKVEGSNIIERIYAKHMPSPLMSVMTDDCIEKAVDYNAGGARYNTSYIQGVGLGELSDILIAIKYNVYENEKFTMEELMKAIENDFEGHEKIHHIVKNRTPKYGNDDDYADEVMKSIFDMYYDTVTGRKNIKGGEYRINMLPTTCHVYFGSVMKASANGRLSKKPLSDGISPAKGADTSGPTAVVNSAAKMDQLKTGGTLLNQKFTPSVVKGEKGLSNMGALVRTYFSQDGHHIQFNVVDKAILLKAKEAPDDYNNLIVRVAGFSDYFNNLDDALQNEIIERTEQEF